MLTTIVTAATILMIALSILLLVYTADIMVGMRMKTKPTIRSEVKDLSFEECNNIIDTIVGDVYNNKYFIQYRLKDLTIIPKMTDEIAMISKEIIESMSPTLYANILKYYTEEYMIASITRKVQALLIDYTDKYKPVSK